MTGEAEARLGGQEAREFGVPALRDIDVDDLPRIADVLDEETFRRARHVVTENARVAAAVAALQAGDPAAACALGARMTGGGFGGAVIALVSRHRVTALTQATQDACTAADFAAPGVRTVTPGPGAHREG